MRISIDDEKNKDKNNDKIESTELKNESETKVKDEYEDDALEYKSLSLIGKIKYRNNQFKKRSESLNTKQKVKYFFDFYKFVIIGGIIAVLVLSYAASTIYKALLPEVLHLAIVNQEYEGEEIDEYVKTSIRTYLNLDDKNYIRLYKNLTVSANEVEDATDLLMTSYQTIGYYNMNDMIDAIICDEEALKTYTWSLDTTAIDMSMDAEMYERLKPYVITLTDTTCVKNEGKPYAGALDITDTEFVKGAGIEYSPVYLLIPSSRYTDNENTLNFIRMVYKF